MQYGPLSRNRGKATNIYVMSGHVLRAGGNKDEKDPGPPFMENGV